MQAKQNNRKYDTRTHQERTATERSIDTLSYAPRLRKASLFLIAPLQDIQDSHCGFQVGSQQVQRLLKKEQELARSRSVTLNVSMTD